MTKPADSMISDLMMTIRFYTNRPNPDAELQELSVVAEHMLETLTCLRRNQIMRQSITEAGERITVQATGTN